jgi:hypothetical protein
MYDNKKTENTLNEKNLNCLTKTKKKSLKNIFYRLLTSADVKRQQKTPRNINKHQKALADENLTN